MKAQSAGIMAFRDAVEQAIAQHHQPQASVMQQAATPTIADQLAQLSQMHASGVLSTEEFAAAKSRLLS